MSSKVFQCIAGIIFIWKSSLLKISFLSTGEYDIWAQVPKSASIGY